MHSDNPFTPAFGGKPQHFFGRSQELLLVERALQDENSPHRALFVTGNRGCGKTALLEQLSLQAKAAGWRTVDVHSSHASIAIAKALTGADSTSHERELEPQAMGASLGHVSTTHTRVYDELDLCDVLLDACRDLKGHNGVFITVDEVQKIPPDDIENLCASAQMALRKGLPIVLVLAGLPGSKEKVASYDGCTFMQRATDVQLDSLFVDETFDAFDRLLSCAPKVRYQRDTVEAMARLSLGYPYLMQLVGYHAVERARELFPVGPRPVTPALVEAIRPVALDAYRNNVLTPVLAPLGAALLDYLQAMETVMKHDGRAASGSVAEALGKTTQQCSSYRQRLMERRLIASDGHGYVRYNLPHMGIYFEDQQETQRNNTRRWKF